MDIAQANSAKNRALSHLVHLAMAEDTLALAEELLLADATPEANRSLITLAMLEEDWAKAENRIHALPPEEADFAGIMAINLHWQSSDTAYVLPSADAESLWQLARGGSPYSGYARGLLTTLQGYYFSPQADELPQPQAQQPPQQSHTSAQTRRVQVFPNPARASLNISWPVLDKEGEVKINLYNATGILSRSIIQPNTGTTQLSLQDLPAGVYWLIIQQGDKAFAPQRVIVQP